MGRGGCSFVFSRLLCVFLKDCMKIMLSAREASGDLHGEGLAKAIHQLKPEAELIGFGGPKMAEAGVRLCADMR